MSKTATEDAILASCKQFECNFSENNAPPWCF